jgi:hypothetical protein
VSGFLIELDNVKLLRLGDNNRGPIWLKHCLMVVGFRGGIRLIIVCVCLRMYHVEYIFVD